MDTNRNTTGSGAANYNVKIENQDAPPGFGSAIQEIVVQDELNMPTMFSLKMGIFQEKEHESGDAAGRARINDKFFDMIAPGQDVTVQMGETTLETMVQGEIACLEPDFDSQPHLTIRGYDGLYRLRFGTKRKSFKEIKDSAIAAQLARENKLIANVEDTGIVHPFIWQNNQSDYEFLLERAERLDYEFLVQDGTLRFFSPKENARPVAILDYLDEVTEFRARLKTITQGGEVDVRSAGYRRNKTITSKARGGDERNKPGPGVRNGTVQQTGFKRSIDGFQRSAIAVMDEPLVDAQDAEILARAKYNRILKNYITGEGSTSFDPKIRAGTTLRLENLGDKFSGVYYVTSSIHTMRSGVLGTTFKVRRAHI